MGVHLLWIAGLRSAQQIPMVEIILLIFVNAQ